MEWLLFHECKGGFCQDSWSDGARFQQMSTEDKLMAQLRKAHGPSGHQDVNAKGEMGNGLSPPDIRNSHHTLLRCPLSERLPTVSSVQWLSHFLVQGNKVFHGI